MTQTARPTPPARSGERHSLLEVGVLGRVQVTQAEVIAGPEPGALRLVEPEQTREPQIHGHVPVEGSGGGGGVRREAEGRECTLYMFTAHCTYTERQTWVWQVSSSQKIHGDCSRSKLDRWQDCITDGVRSGSVQKSSPETSTYFSPPIAVMHSRPRLGRGTGGGFALSFER